jgi:hypothetical protein
MLFKSLYTYIAFMIGNLDDAMMVTMVKATSFLGRGASAKGPIPIVTKAGKIGRVAPLYPIMPYLPHVFGIYYGILKI